MRMIRKPKLPPIPGYVEIMLGGKRMYRNTKTGKIYAPGEVQSEEAQKQAEFLERFRRTDEYALLDYLFMMEGLTL